MQNIEQILSTYGPKLSDLGLQLRTYSQSEDVLFLKWWMQLNESGEISQFIAPDSFRLITFFSLFESPHIVFYHIDQNQLAFVFWLADIRPQFGTTFANVWARSDFHGGSENFLRLAKMASLCHDLTFEFLRTIFAITWSQKTLKLCSKIGYNTVGTMDNYFGQERVFMLQLKRDEFKNSRFSGIGG